MDQSLLVEKLADLVAGHLLSAGTLTDEELAAKGVGLALLPGDGYAHYFADALHLHSYRRFGGTGSGLHFRFQTIVIADPDDLSMIGYPDHQYPASCIGKSAYLPPDAGRAGSLELGSETFTEGNEIGKHLFVNTATSLIVRMTGPKSLLLYAKTHSQPSCCSRYSAVVC